MSNPEGAARRRTTLESTAFVVAMLVVCALAWWIGERPRLEVDPTPLASLPATLGRWRSTPLPLESEVEAELRADYNVLRAYLTPGEVPIALYVGYYGTARGGRPEHTPRFCYTGAGWGIVESRTVKLSRERDLRATEYLVERDKERQLVHFWYRSHRRSGLLGGFDQNLDRMLGLIVDGRADGALVRLSTPVLEGDVDRARSRLIAFGGVIDEALADHWPTERPEELRVAGEIAP